MECFLCCSYNRIGGRGCTPRCGGCALGVVRAAGGRRKKDVRDVESPGVEVTSTGPGQVETGGLLGDGDRAGLRLW